jgi:hypothetical protein
MRLILIIFSFFLFSFGFQGDYRFVENDSFVAGESYHYKIKYGFFTIGEANVDVDEKIYNVNQRACFKINVVGRTAGMTNIFKVSNTYRTYLDTLAFVPQRFIYSARENNFKRDQVISFNHSKNEVLKTEKDQTKTFSVPNNIQDVISAYYLIRTFDYNAQALGKTFAAPVFFDEELYPMKIKFAGKGTVNTKFGKIKVLKLNPILPPNELFKGENAIRIWVSDDKNRVPIQVEIDFSIGTVVMEIKKYHGQKFPFVWK